MRGRQRVAAVALLAAVTASTASCGLVGDRLAAPGLRPGVDVPSEVGDVAASPLGVPALAPGGSGGYAFLAAHPDGSPVTFDPCRPLHYVVRPAGQPEGGAELVRWAFAEISRATGLQVVEDGPTDEGPSVARPSYQPARYGDRWAPVLVAWSGPEETPLLTASGPAGGAAVLGRAGPDAFGTDEPGSRRFVTGQAVFNAALVGRQLATGSDAKARAVLLHELGHLVGLAHVADPYQVMYDTNAFPLARYRAGDLRGLELLGSGRCFTDF